jgi:hypothetical protein
MGSVLGWLPVVWAMRIALLVLLAGCSYLYLLLIAPFFRPAHVLRLLRADLPRVRRFGAEVAGTGGEVELADDERLARVEAQLEVLVQEKRSAPREDGADEDKAW